MAVLPEPASQLPRPVVVISQPMLFPWVGLFEQIRLADVYVHYTDVQFSKGSFVNRVQIKTAKGAHWLTVPLRGLALGQTIAEVLVDDRKDWRRSHLDLLAQAFARAPFRREALDLAEHTYARRAERLVDIVVAGLEAVMTFFGLDQGCKVLRVEELGIDGSGSERVLAIVQALDGRTYVTGHGARNYLQHEAFDRAGIGVEYMDYRKTPYPQLHGEFTPYVSILDLISNLGRDGARCIHSGTLHWRRFK